MRRKDRELSSKEELIGIIESADVCRIALHSERAPYIVPLSYGYSWTDSLELYFHCAKEGRKLDLLRQNNSVGFEIDTSHALITADKACSWGMKYRSIIGIGRISQIDDEEEREKALTRIMIHYNFEGKPEFDPNAKGNTTLLKMVVEELTGKEKK